MLKRAHDQAGLSVVELLVGVAVGLFIIGGAIKLFVDYLSDSRRLLVETRVNQDLRAAADIVARDLRRSGYWQSAIPLGFPSAASAVVFPAASNPYAVAAAASTAVTYHYSRGVENNEINTATGQPNENFGFRLVNGSIEAQTAAGVWQQLTDPNAVQVTTFTVATAHQELTLGQYCTPACALGSAGCPSVFVRRFDITLVGNATPPNNAVQRRVDISVRPRNDEIPTPNCP